MMRYGISFDLGDILFTHYHTDHVLGVIGLFRTIQLGGGRTEPLPYGDPGACADSCNTLKHSAASGAASRSSNTSSNPASPIDAPAMRFSRFPVDHAAPAPSATP